MEAVNASESRKLGQRNILGEVFREVVARQRNSPRGTRTKVAMWRGLAMAVSKLDERSDQQGFALKPCLRMLEDAMELRETVGERCVTDDCMREERQRYTSPRRLLNCRSKHGGLDVNHAI
jgi:hypothetical protein